MNRLRTVSLRRRVTALSMLVLAAVLLVVGVLTDVVFAAQSRADLRGELTVQAGLAGQLSAQGVGPVEVVRRVRTPEIQVVLERPNGTVYRGEGPMPRPRRPGPVSVIRSCARRSPTARSSP